MFVQSSDTSPPCLHGVTFADAAGRASPAGNPDLRHVVLTFADAAPHFDPEPVWAHVDRGARFTSRVALHSHPDGWVIDIDCEGKGTFLVTGQGIVVHWRSGTDPWHYLQTIGLAVYLELQGVLCLHANTLRNGHTTIGLIGASRAGKSTLTTALVRAGWSMLSDDMAALHGSPDGWRLYPSRSQTRLWPDAGEYFHGPAYHDYGRVHARFDKRIVDIASAQTHGPAAPQALDRLYLLDRSMDPQATISIAWVSAAEAVLELLTNSIIGDAAGVLGLEQERLPALAQLTSQVTVKRITYPSGFDRLGELTKVITEDCQSVD